MQNRNEESEELRKWPKQDLYFISSHPVLSNMKHKNTKTQKCKIGARKARKARKWRGRNAEGKNKRAALLSKQRLFVWYYRVFISSKAFPFPLKSFLWFQEPFSRRIRMKGCSSDRKNYRSFLRLVPSWQDKWMK